MPTIRRHAEAAKPPADVWALWSDVRLLPQLSRHTVEVRGAPDQLTTVGQTFTQVVQAVGRRFESTWTVTDIVDGEHLTIEGSVGYGVTYRLTEKVEPLGADRTRCTLTVEYELPFGPLGRVASKLGLGTLAEREAADVLAGVVAMAEAATPANG